MDSTRAPRSFTHSRTPIFPSFYDPRFREVGIEHIGTASKQTIARS
jgi:hypothetical protein